MTADSPERDWGLVEAGDLTGAYRAATANLARWPHTGAHAWNRGTCLLALVHVGSNRLAVRRPVPCPDRSI